MLKSINNALFFFAVIIFFASFRTYAADEMNCTSDDSAYTLNLDNVLVEENAQPGNIVYVDTHEVHVTCTSSGNYQQVSEVSNTGWSSSGMTISVDGLTCPVIDNGTAISDAGLGIVWTNYNSTNRTWTCMSEAFSGSSIRRGLTSNGTTTLTDKIYIVRTNKELDYGETSELSQTVYVDEADADRISRGHLYSFTFSGSISVYAGGCTIENTINVDMGKISSASFLGVGSTGPEVPFSILLQNCHGVVTSAYFDFTPVYGFANQEASVIALNDDDNAATGVGIQLLISGEKIGWNDDVYYPITTGNNTVNFTATYYQVEETVTPGNADTTVVFNVYYD
ncbi:fimbrial protein [Brenneria goodwinii]|uniref:fimbrial protein n=1 Tax=Brenneria goodwinii TaxID=1109412 RepID=UPI0036EF8FEA